MTLNYVTLTITEQDAGNDAGAGPVVIAPTSAIVAAGQTVVSAQPVTRTMANGTLSVQLVACDNAGTSPAAGFWAYQITLPGGTPQLYLVNFANGSSQRFDSLTPVIAQTTYGPAASSGSGSVTSVSVTAANGLTGTVANPSTTPALTLGTTVTGLLKGNGTAISAAAAGTDYLTPGGNGSQLTGLTESQVGSLTSDLTALSAGITARAALAGATFTGYLAPAVAALTFGASIAVNAALANVFTVTLSSSAGTIQNPANAVDGQIIRFRIAQDATGGRAVAWGTAYDFGSGSAPSLTATASKTDVLAFEYNAAISKWMYLGAAVPQGF